MTSREIVIGAARKYGVSDGGRPHPRREYIGDNAMISTMEWGCWVGASIYVSDVDMQKYGESGKPKEDG